MILIVTVCLLLAPSECHDERRDLAEVALTPHACMSQALPEIARMTEGRPMHFVRSWRCAPASERRV
jgi:hypothetical protein